MLTIITNKLNFCCFKLVERSKRSELFNSKEKLHFYKFINYILINNKRMAFTTNVVCKKNDEEKKSIVDYWLNKQSENDYLKDVLGEKAIEWVKEKNEVCLNVLGNPETKTLYNQVLSILDNKDKIPEVRKIGNLYYNFWQDATNKRGLWRRTTIESYRSINPIWENVLDIDELCKIENESWVWKGHRLYRSKNIDELPTRTLLLLSKGGSDATVIREFNLETKQFVNPFNEEQGFYVSEAKSSVSWIHENCLLIGTDLHDNQSLTTSGYPRVVRFWKRGEKIENSKIIYEGNIDDVSVNGYMVNNYNYIYFI